VTPAGSYPEVGLAELTPQHAHSHVSVLGRVLSRGDDQAQLVHAGQSILLRGTMLPDELSLARAEGVWRGTWLDVQRCTVLRTPAVTRPLREHAIYPFVRDGQRKYARLKARARMLSELRGFFDARGFLEVETPLVVPSPGLDVHLDALRVETRGGERFLITSPEYQMKRLLAAGFGPIYQLAKCFRNDELGERHQPEFTMLEWYRPFAGVDEVMRDTEELVAHLALWLHGSLLLPTAFGAVDVTPPWPRLTVREAFARFAGKRLDDLLDDEATLFEVLVTEVEPRLARLGAVMLCDYPISMASLARARPGDPAVAERFEAYVAGLELCNGFGELTAPDEQRARLMRDQAERQQRGLPVYPLDERFLAALEDGMPESGGNALGVDRLVMLLLGAAHIEDVLAVPGSQL
jgi:lysyl-tRNA synthetase class 2